jgi:hypothetical protein
MNHKTFTILLTTLFLLGATVCIQAQTPLTLPETSPKTIMTQTIGLTDITMVYHSPQVKGRKIWGELVPYNLIWRAGANENTTISFEHDVTVEGKLLKAGTYGLHMIPTEGEWTVIFSKNHTSWGSFFYREDEDALRVKVKPEQIALREWLLYDFVSRKSDAAVLALEWEKLRIPVKIGVDVHAIVLASARDELRSVQGFSWLGWYDAARYCFDNNINSEEAMKWINRSIAAEENFTNLSLKSQMLEKEGRTKESADIMNKAMAMANESQLNVYGYRLLGQNKNQEAIEVFKSVVKRYPNSWNAYDSLGEGFEKSGDKKQSVANYKQALKRAPEDQRSRIENTIKKLEAK